MSASDYIVELVKRHGSHHFINVKYGYIALLLSICYLIFRIVSLSIYNNSWAKSGRSTTRLGLVKIPLVYTVFFMSLIIILIEVFNLHISEPTIHIKRAGRLAYALVPLDIFLAIRPSPIKLDNYLDTLKIHKWLSRLILVFGIAHGTGFLIKWGINNTLLKTFAPLNAAGLVVFIFFFALLIVNWKPIRSRCYKWFYLLHNITLWLFVILVCIHARPGVTLIAIINVIMLLYQFFVKCMSLKNVVISEVTGNEGSDLKIVRVSKSLLPASYEPGCHLRIGSSLKSVSFWLFPSHPYTVSTICGDRHSTHIDLIVKESSFQFKPDETYSIQPFFHSSLSLNFFQTAENVNIVCGGSGISLGLAIFDHFKMKIHVDLKNVKIGFIWITPRKEDLYILKQLRVEGVDVYVTGSSDYFKSQRTRYEPLSTRNSNEFQEVSLNNSSAHDPFSDTVELESLNAVDRYNGDRINLADGDFDDQEDQEDELQLKFINKVHYGKRPPLRNILTRNLDKTIDYANKWIVSCGPSNLISDCSEIADECKCQYFSEEYSM